MVNPLNLLGAGGENRTPMPLRAEDFESSASTSFTTPAIKAGSSYENYGVLSTKDSLTARMLPISFNGA
jgi:hypothetical protein